MNPKLRIASITDEFSPQLGPALEAMQAIGMTGAELRVVWGKNIMDLNDGELDKAVDLCRRHGMEIISIASPILKCVLPGGPGVDPRFQQDTFNAKHTFDDQQRLLDHAVQICEKTGAKIIRVFSYWRTIDPPKCFDAVVKAVSGMADQVKSKGLIIGLENEHACNVATATEAAAALNAIPNENVKLVWDPANSVCAGENPFPYGYGLLPKNRIVHVHTKDCHMEGHKPIWGPLGTRSIDWKGQIAALMADGYTGWLSLETHWPGPNGDKMEASKICGWNLRGLSAA
ncbi:MAG TPA: sugar phosphate isomerase/epimerase family protein [Bryobacteraceae bacterium]|nr:sugar phosphate isomerase/epimerase family protein [Bryobacteraceae bacterium]